MAFIAVQLVEGEIFTSLNVEILEHIDYTLIFSNIEHDVKLAIQT